MADGRFEDGTGGIIVVVTTGISAIPVEGAKVAITKIGENGEELIRQMVTDRSGRTELVEVPTPNIAMSESPQTGQPYAVYNVKIAEDRYREVSDIGVQVFPMTVSILPVSLIPLPEEEQQSGEEQLDVNLIPPHDLTNN